MMERSMKRRAGFTLIEVMLVIGILLVLSTVGVVAYDQLQKGQYKRMADIMVKSTADAVNLYRMDIGTVPDTSVGLQALITKPDNQKEADKWNGPYLKDGKIPLDPWNNELKYEKLDGETGPGFKVFSYGPDGREGSDDDISSYKEGS